MKKTNLFLLSSLLLIGGLASCGENSTTKEIIVGATPAPHEEILKCDAVQSYVKSKGYTLTVKEYQDYVLPNQALRDGTLDANYFQHYPYLSKQIAQYNYDFAAVAQVHNEPLNLYGPTNVTCESKSEVPTVFANKTVSIINDASNVERAYDLLKYWGVIDSYSAEGFDASHLVYTTSVPGLTIKSIDSGSLHLKVEDGEFAVIPGNFALTSWGASKATEYKVFGESSSAAYPNLIVSRSEDKNNEKINILVDALAQDSVKSFIETKYGPTVNYCFKDLRAN